MRILKLLFLKMKFTNFGRTHVFYSMITPLPSLPIIIKIACQNYMFMCILSFA